MPPGTTGRTMKISVCHYSYHRCWEKGNWNCDRLAAEVKSIGADAVDFHVRFLGSPNTAAERISAALRKHGLSLSGLSHGNNFNLPDKKALKEQIGNVKRWLRVAKEVNAPVSRIFGGHIHSRDDSTALSEAFDRIMPAIEDVTAEAERLGVVLALENHGGLPCSGEEQVKIIETVNSPFLRATVDVGNYMQGGQEGHEGTAAAAHLAAYVHFKDFKKTSPPFGVGAPWGLQACIVGEGDVDHLKCLRILKKAGYKGYIALEYEGPEDEELGVPRSLEFTKNIIEEASKD